MSRLPLIFLILSSIPLFGQSQASSPLTSEEKRQILLQLYELRSCRESVQSYEQFVSRETEQDGRERANYERSLELERQATALAQKERDLAQDKATFYEQALKAVTKQPGIGCRILRVLTAGIHRCQ